MRLSSLSIAIGFLALLGAGTKAAAQNDRKPPTVAVQQPTGGIDTVMALSLIHI